MKKILVLCTGNRCRSQMAQGILASMAEKGDNGKKVELEVCSAGISPALEVHPLAVKVMGEIGIDISAHYPKSVERYLDQPWDYVITVCGGARESCPHFQGKVQKRMHIGFDDPDAFRGSEEEVLTEFRRVRDEIREELGEFFQKEILASSCSWKERAVRGS